MSGQMRDWVARGRGRGTASRVDNITADSTGSLLIWLGENPLQPNSSCKQLAIARNTGTPATWQIPWFGDCVSHPNITAWSCVWFKTSNPMVSSSDARCGPCRFLLAASAVRGHHLPPPRCRCLQCWDHLPQLPWPRVHGCQWESYLLQNYGNILSCASKIYPAGTQLGTLLSFSFTWLHYTQLKGGFAKGNSILV